jgi:hypothetical protein
VAGDDRRWEAFVLGRHGAERRWGRLGLEGINDLDVVRALQAEHDTRQSRKPEHADRIEHLLLIHGKKVTVVTAPPDEWTKGRHEEDGIYLDDWDDFIVTAFPGW